jgi:hypothetical protein
VQSQGQLWWTCIGAAAQRLRLLESAPRYRMVALMQRTSWSQTNYVHAPAQVEIHQQRQKKIDKLP